MTADLGATAEPRSEQPRVLIVGAGPAGLVAGIVLARHGVEVVVAEKRAAGSTLSRALVGSSRNTPETCRRASGGRSGVAG